MRRQVACTALCLGVSYDFQRKETKWISACSACSVRSCLPQSFSLLELSLSAQVSTSGRSTAGRDGSFGCY